MLELEVAGSVAFRCTVTLWTDLLHDAFPEFVQAKVPLEDMIVFLLTRARLAATQATPVLFDFVDFWAGSGILTKECIRRMTYSCRLGRMYDAPGSPGQVVTA